jgi:hypothetical protein
MRLTVEIAGVAAATVALCLATPSLVARGLRLHGLQAQLVATGVRLVAALLLAVALAASGSEHRVALVFTVGAAYFAATAIDGIRRFRNRETSGCSTR